MPFLPPNQQRQSTEGTNFETLLLTLYCLPFSETVDKFDSRCQERLTLLNGFAITEVLQVI